MITCLQVPPSFPPPKKKIKIYISSCYTLSKYLLKGSPITRRAYTQHGQEKKQKRLQDGRQGKAMKQISRSNQKVHGTA